ncbi:uncharacterized protein isoform X2 [Rhodnius prolixus]|uniref:uncharacterized protein isoform X2 n=1 Tax=Rhodnius prolixus TaxID=13249 RepID=UPI003D187B21
MVMSSLSSRDISGFKTDGNLKWSLNFSDESGDEEQLTSLVRNSYIKHLKRCLSKNYEKWSKTNISIDELNFCSEMLENKALRSCMVTSIYQRSMAQILKEIKEATQKEILYDGFRKKLDLFENVKCDKETQTFNEQLETKKETVICNDEILLNSNNSNSSFSNSKSLFLETFGETEATINKKLEQDANGTDSYEELLNILLSSPKEMYTTESSLNECEKLKETPSLCKKRKLLNGNHQSAPQNISKEKVEVENVNICPQVNDIAGLARVSNVPEEKKSTKFNTSLLVNWSYEHLVQITHLENILSKLKPYKRVIVEKRFKDLFGNDLIAEQEVKKPKISEEELNSCRKRIARIIVGELTPFYVGGKIGSRPVFKNLAKKLTDDILCTTFTPGKEIQRVLEKLCRVFL